ncbi:hypothetical protein AAG570_005903 [Ranatra chinensis]|uniref:Uncharacterized protein n=1 Tax=Ranatra chinensis TaxID=642074 RepID=A0ABD0XWS8_9HEMI
MNNDPDSTAEDGGYPKPAKSKRRQITEFFQQLVETNQGIRDLARGELYKMRTPTITIDGLMDCNRTLNRINLTGVPIERNVYNLSGYVRLFEPIYRPLGMSIDVYNCVGGYGDKNCQFQKNLKVNGICEFISAKGMPWTGMLENSSVPRSCPLKKVSVNGTEVLNAARGLPSVLLDEKGSGLGAPGPPGIWSIRRRRRI